MRKDNSVTQRLIFLAAVTYQAIQQFETSGQFTLPTGYRLVTSLGAGDYPFIGFVIQSNNDAIVAFRGTEDFYDFLRDLDLFQVPFSDKPLAGKVSRGFADIYNTIRSQLLTALQGLSAASITVTGHSLGGALATLAGLDIALHLPLLTPNVFTFASPRVGNPTFASTFNRRIRTSIRVVNNNDVIPLLPPKKIPFSRVHYQHVHGELPISFQTDDPLDNHEMIYYFKELCRLNPQACATVCDQFMLCPLTT